MGYKMIISYSIITATFIIGISSQERLSLLPFSLSLFPNLYEFTDTLKIQCVQSIPVIVLILMHGLFQSQPEGTPSSWSISFWWRLCTHGLIFGQLHLKAKGIEGAETHQPSDKHSTHIVWLILTKTYKVSNTCILLRYFKVL